MRIDFDPARPGYLRLTLPVEVLGRMTSLVVGGILPVRALEVLAELEALDDDS